MLDRLYRALVAAGFVVVLLGVLALSLAEAGGAELEFWRAIAWYAARQWSANPLLWGALVVTALALAALAVTVRREEAAFRRDLRRGAVPIRKLGVAEQAQLAQRARAAMEPELSRARPRIERVIDSLLGALVDHGASDLSLEPTGETVAVRLNVGMDELEVMSITPALRDLIAARLGYMIGAEEGDVDVSGTLKLRTGDAEERIRVRLVGTEEGTRVRLQLLRRGQRALTLDRLQMARPLLQRLRRALGEQTGLVVVCGPRGHGVATTLYAAAHFAAQKRSPGSVASIEPEVRLELPFMQQVEVGAGNPAALLASLLRESFKVVLVRGIDDMETARRTVDAAASRLLIVSIVGAKEPFEAMARGVLLGGSGAVFADVLRLALGQRLLPRLCPSCRRVRDLAPEEQRALSAYHLEDKRLFQHVGCHECKGRGFSGLIPLYWAVEPTPWLTELLRRRASAVELQREALAHDVQWPVTAALDLALEGEIDARTLVRLQEEGPWA